MQACHSIQKLVEVVGMMLYSVSKHLMAALMPLLTHKRHTLLSLLELGRVNRSSAACMCNNA